MNEKTIVVSQAEGAEIEAGDHTEPKTILVSERAWQEVQGGIRALRLDYEALVKETKDVKAKYEALLKERTP